MRLAALLVFLGGFAGWPWAMAGLDQFQKAQPDAPTIAIATPAATQPVQAGLAFLRWLPQAVPFSPAAGAYAFAVALGALWLARGRHRWSWLGAGTLCGIAGFAPYGALLIFLAIGASPAHASLWSPFVLASMVYSASIGSLFALLHLIQPNPSRRRCIFQGPPRREKPPLLDISTVYLSRWQ